LNFLAAEYPERYCNLHPHPKNQKHGSATVVKECGRRPAIAAATETGRRFGMVIIPTSTSQRKKVARWGILVFLDANE
jgi:hypothetical protein